jgi:hypothetical protein
MMSFSARAAESPCKRLAADLHGHFAHSQNDAHGLSGKGKNEGHSQSIGPWTKSVCERFQRVASRPAGHHVPIEPLTETGLTLNMRRN